MKEAEEDAERAEDDASDTPDYAAWAVGQAAVAVLDTATARAWAAERAAPRRLAEHRPGGILAGIGHRYSLLRIHMRVNQPTTGGR